ncbi:beta-lactamase-like protein [Mycena galericulata]|nr:beta-lactamase-like protein [Mycena galericulata]
MLTELLFCSAAGAVLVAVASSFMHLYWRKLGENNAGRDFNATPRTAFRATRLTSSTFVLSVTSLSEYNDVFQEHPLIYVKVVPSAQTILIIDTGCGGTTVDPTIEITSLRQFIEEVRLDCNDGAALNEGKHMEYVVVISHCHYDHILGVEQFHDKSRILASSHSPSFISESNLPTNSLCEILGIKTPAYTPTQVPHRHTVCSKTLVPFGVTILHTPGHTPDELAVYDAAEKMLYVGDSLYEEETIIFPKEGSIIDWMSSIEYLIAFVEADSQTEQVRINSGHRTVCRPALEVLDAAKKFMEDVISGKEPVRKRVIVRGEETVIYEQRGGRFALRCPERLVLAARKISKM